MSKKLPLQSYLQIVELDAKEKRRKARHSVFNGNLPVDTLRPPCPVRRRLDEPRPAGKHLGCIPTDGMTHLRTILLAIACSSLAGSHLFAQAASEGKTNENGNETKILGRTQCDAISIIKILENDKMAYCVVIVPSYLTRASKISIDRFRRYATLNEAIATVQKHVNANNSYAQNLVSDNCLPLLHYDPDRIRVIGFTRDEMDKLEIYHIVTGD